MERTDGLGHLYETHSSGAFRLAYLLTGDKHAAEDLAQEAFVRIGRKVIPFRDDEHARAYLYRTVINLSRGRARRARIERAALARFPRTETDEQPDLPHQDSMWRALLTLPERQRAALFLRFYLDHSEATAADVLGCSPSALKSLVSRGLKALRTSIGDER